MYREQYQLVGMTILCILMAFCQTSLSPVVSTGDNEVLLILSHKFNIAKYTQNCKPSIDLFLLSVKRVEEIKYVEIFKNLMLRCILCL